MQPFEFQHQVTQPEQTAIAILSAQLDLSVAEIKSAINKGALWHKKHNAPKKSVQRLRRFKKVLQKGDEIYFYYNIDVLSQTPSDATLIEDCKDYSVWHKPYGMLAQGSKWSDHCTINRWVQNYFDNQRQCFIVHRLDRATSGLMVIAHTKTAAKAFGQIFESRQLTKTYQAICHQQAPLLEQEFTLTTPVNDKAAISHFKVVKQANDLALVMFDVKIDTGRKHQIRIHCASIKHPIVGDRLHGMAQEAPLDLQLCAKELSFTCPLTEQVKSYQLPKGLQLDWQKATELLGH